MAAKQSSAEKRHKQSEVSRLRNKSAKSSLRTSTRKYLEAVHAKDEALASERLKMLVKEIDTVANKGILHRNTASRKKSRMMKLFNVSFNTVAK